MHFDLLLVSITISISVVAIIIFSVTFFNRKKFHGYWGVPLLFLLHGIYALGYAMELSSDTLLLKIIFNHVQNIAIPFIAVTWLFVAKRFTNQRLKFVWKKEIMYLIIPFILFIASQLHYFTNIGWYYGNYWLENFQGLFGYEISVLILEKSFLYYLGQAYNIIIIGYVAYLYIIRSKEVNGIQSKQALQMAICSVLASVLVVPAFFSPNTSSIDLTLYYLSLIGYLILYTVYHYEFITLMPLVNKSLFSDANAPILIFDDKFDLVEWNSKVDVFDFIKPEYQQKIDKVISLPNLVEAIKQTKPYSFDYIQMHFVIDVLEMKNKSSLSVGYVVHFLEMSIFADKLNKLDYQAKHDSLTDTFNRNGFIEEFNQRLHILNNEDGLFSLLMYDFDDFKGVNDQYGHLAGDLVLKETSQLIFNSLPKDAILCRYGGEEFLVFIPNISLSDSLTYAYHIRDLIEKHPITYQDKLINVQISVGLYNSTKLKVESLENLIEKADKALYESKRTGKNKVSSY